MGKKIIGYTKPPAWLIKEIKKHADDLPVGNPMHSSALVHIDYAFSEYEKRFNNLSSDNTYSILDADAFKRKCEMLCESVSQSVSQE